MKRQRRGGVVLLAALLFAGCSYWQPQIVAARDALAGPDLSQVRLTRTDGETVVVRVAEIRGDTIYGTAGTTGSLTCDQASEDCGVQMPVSEVGFVELRRFSAIKSAALVGVPLGAFLVLFAAGS